jgi:polygalacturonase
MKRFIFLACVVGLIGIRGAAGQSTLPSDFSVDKPRIPNATFNITDYGAVGDGKTLCTDAITKTIAAAESAGGGIVEIPPGKFLTGPFALASNLNLHLDSGATLVFSDQRKDFKLVDDGYENCITAHDCHDLEITGSGTIDGQGKSWWDEFSKFKHGDAGQAPPHRPYLIIVINCTRFMVQGVTLTNSPMFHLVPRTCQDVTIDSVNIKAPALSPNTDGIDPSGWNFLISRCTIDTGDDNIALKPRPVPNHSASCENFLIEYCRFIHGHGMSIGGGSYGGVRNMTVRNCSFEDTDSGVRLKSGRDRGGLAENLTYQNLTMKRVKTSIFITSYYPIIPDYPDLDPAQKITGRTPIWRNIVIDHVSSEDGITSVRILGLGEMPVQDVALSNVRITSQKPMQIIHAHAVTFTNSHVTNTSGQPNQLVDAQVKGL